MTPEQKCVSLETAKRLKEAGFPQETERAWFRSKEQRAFLECRTLLEKSIDADLIEGRVIAAPDAQEIGELLPFYVRVDERTWLLYQGRQGNVWNFGYEAMRDDSALVPGKSFLNDSEAEARAQCWLWLKEQGLL